MVAKLGNFLQKSANYVLNRASGCQKKSSGCLSFAFFGACFGLDVGITCLLFAGALYFCQCLGVSGGAMGLALFLLVFYNMCVVCGGLVFLCIFASV